MGHVPTVEVKATTVMESDTFAGDNAATPKPDTPSDANDDILRANLGRALFGREAFASAKVGRYSVLGQLGEGGMGVVYKAHDEELDRPIALKLVRDDAIDPVTGRARMMREAKALAKLQHPNVVGIFEVGTHENQLFIAMEFVEGQTLRAWLESASPGPAEILKVFVQAGRGLQAAHEAGLIHRDFKPDNVLLDPTGRVRVLDFGLAGAALAEEITQVDAEATIDELTRTGTLMGTPAYMAPEQMEGAKTGPACDQFSFCVALYEALYGKRPFAGRSLRELADALRDGPSPPPPGGPRVDGRVRAALTRGLQHDVGARYPSIGELLAALEPTNARRRWSTIAVAAAVAGVVAAGAYGLTAEEGVEPCPDAQDEQSRVWGEQRRARVEDAVDPEHWASTEQAATRRVEQWVQAYPVACADEGVPIEERAARRLCLGDALAQIDATLAVLETDPSQAAYAAEVLWWSAPAERCTDARALQVPERTDEERRARVELRFVGARVQTMLHGDERDAGLAEQMAATKRARLTGISGAIAEALAREGIAFALSGQKPEALQRYQSAIAEAEKAGDTPLRMMMENGVACLSFFIPQERSRAATRVERALASEERFGPDPVLDAYAAFMSGLLANQQGDHEAGLQFYERTEELRAEHDPFHVGRGATLNNIGQQQRELGRPADAIATLERALALAEARSGFLRFDRLYPLFTLAGAYGDVGRHREAVAAGQESVAIARELNKGPQLTLANTFLRDALVRAKRWAEADAANTAIVDAAALSETGMPLEKQFSAATWGAALATLAGHPKRAEARLSALKARLDDNLPPLVRRTNPEYWVVTAARASLRAELHLPGAADEAREALAVLPMLPTDHPAVTDLLIYAAYALHHAGADRAEVEALADRLPRELPRDNPAADVLRAEALGRLNAALGR